jgi:hypothetical protein
VQYRPADVQFRSKVALGREAFSNLEFSGQDHLFQSGNAGFLQALYLDRLNNSIHAAPEFKSGKTTSHYLQYSVFLNKYNR